MSGAQQGGMRSTRAVRNRQGPGWVGTLALLADQARKQGVTDRAALYAVAAGVALVCCVVPMVWWVRPRRSWDRLVDRAPWSVLLVVCSAVAASQGTRAALVPVLLVALVGVIAPEPWRAKAGRSRALLARVCRQASWGVGLLAAAAALVVRGAHRDPLLFTVLGGAAVAWAAFPDRRRRATDALARRWTRHVVPSAAARVPGPKPRPAATASRILGVAALVAVATTLFLVGVHRQIDRFNPDPVSTQHDEASYVQYIGDLRDRPDQVVLNRFDMPLYPWVVSLVSSGGSDGDQLFRAALWTNVAIALIGLAMIAWVMHRRCGLLASAVATGLLAFTMFLFLASWVLADILSALLFSLLLAALWRLLQHPSAIRGATVGILAGVTHLSKPVASPAIVVFVACCLLGLAVPRLVPAAHRPTSGSSLAAVVSLVVLFGLTIAPYSANSARAYGDPFYNVNTKYYLWYDTYAEAASGTIRAGDQYGAPDLPADQIPTASKYFREHSLGQVVGRFRDGFRIQYDLAMTGGQSWGGFAGYFGYGPFVLVLVAGAVAAVAANAARSRAFVRRNLLPCIFLASTFAVFDLAIAWRMPFGSGNRYMLPLFLPGVLICVWAIQRGLSSWTVRGLGRAVRVDALVLGLLAVGVAAQAVWAPLVTSTKTLGGY